MKFNFMDHKTRALFIFALSVILFVLSFLFLLSARSFYIQEKMVLKEAYSEFSQKLKRRDALLQLTANKDLRDKIDQVNNFAIDANQALLFLSFLENKINEFGLDGQIVSAKFKKVNKKRFGILKLQIHVKGGEPNILRFVNVVQSLPYILKIESVRFFNEENKKVLDMSVDFYTINNK